MDEIKYNFKIKENGRPDSVVNTTMERAIDITRARAINRRTEVVLYVENSQGRFIPLGTYAYFPDKDGERQLLVVPKLPKHIKITYSYDNY